MNMNDLPVAIVIPCLNEESNLLRTCRSFGFGHSEKNADSNTFLFLIDNGSTDATLEVARRIRDDSRDNSVFIDVENSRGYVPRNKGNQLIKDLCQQKGWDQKEVLVLQADAGRLYLPGYVAAMRKASILNASQTILEGHTRYPIEFIDNFRQFIEIQSQSEEKYEKFFVDYEEDVILDDKVCGYRLKDYLEFGD